MIDQMSRGLHVWEQDSLGGALVVMHVVSGGTSAELTNERIWLGVDKA
jgi:hypothetical protein